VTIIEGLFVQRELAGAFNPVLLCPCFCLCTLSALPNRCQLQSFFKAIFNLFL
jgi:hypothetical protein